MIEEMRPELDHKMGKHEAEISQLKDDMRQLKNDVHEIKLMLAEAKGGWRGLMFVAGAAATVGAFVAKFLPWFGGR